MRVSRCFIAVSFLLSATQVIALRAATAKSDPAAPVSGTTTPAGAVNLAPADVKELQTAIKALHDRYEEQGKALTKANETLEILRSRIEQDLHPVDLDSLTEGLGKIVRNIADLQSAVGKLAAAQEQRAAGETLKFAEFTVALTSLKEQVAKLDENLAQLRKTVAARAAPAPQPVESGFRFGAVLALSAVCTLLLAGLIVYTSRLQHRERQTLRGELTAATNQTREHLQQSLQATAADWNRALTDREQRLTDTLNEMQRLLTQLAHAETRSDAAWPPDETTPPMPADEKTTVSGGSSLAYSDALWPAVFLDPSSPLTRWRALLESHLSSPEHPALAVLSAVLALRVTLERSAPPLPDVADAVAAVSLAIHAYWSSLAEFGEEARQHANADWIRGLKHLVATAAPSLDIREIVPGARFDPNTMQTVQEGSGNHLNVATVYSWVILDRSGERPRTLHRARIATT